MCVCVYIYCEVTCFLFYSKMSYDFGKKIKKPLKNIFKIIEKKNYWKILYEDFLISYNISRFLISYNIFKNISRFFLKRSFLPTTCVIQLHPILVPFIIYIL